MKLFVIDNKKITIDEIKLLERYYREYNIVVFLFIGKLIDVVMFLVNKLELWF